MAADPPGPPGTSNHDDRPGQQPTEPLGGPAQPFQPAPASGQPGSERWSPTPTTPLPGDPSAPPAFAAAGPPREALAGFWRRLVAAFLDWILIGILAAAIGDLFGVEGPTPPAADGDGFNFQFAGTGPFILVELVYFTYFHATSAGQSIGNKILGIGCWTPTPAAPCPMPGRSSAPHEQPLRPPMLSGLLRMCGNHASGPGTTWSPTAWSSGPPSTHPASSAAPHTNEPRGEGQRCQ